MSDFATFSTSQGKVLFPNRATLRLYERAVAEQWKLETDVDWNALVFDHVAPPVRSAMTAVYSYVHYAETFGLGMCGKLVEQADPGWLRELATTQFIDETRHVQFFTRIVDRLGSGTEVPDALVRLSQDLAATDGVLELMLHAQVLESGAQALFVETARRSRSMMANAIRVPGSDAIARLLDYMIRLIGRDEARHIGYGQQYLFGRMRDLSPVERRRMEVRVGDWCRLYQVAFAELRPAATRLSLSMEKLLQGVWRAQRHQFHRLGFEIGEFEHSSVDRRGPE